MASSTQILLFACVLIALCSLHVHAATPRRRYAMTQGDISSSKPHNLIKSVAYDRVPREFFRDQSPSRHHRPSYRGRAEMTRQERKHMQNLLLKMKSFSPVKSRHDGRKRSASYRSYPQRYLRESRNENLVDDVYPKDDDNLAGDIDTINHSKQSAESNEFQQNHKLVKNINDESLEQTKNSGDNIDDDTPHTISESGLAPVDEDQPENVSIPINTNDEGEGEHIKPEKTTDQGVDPVHKGELPPSDEKPDDQIGTIDKTSLPPIETNVTLEPGTELNHINLLEGVIPTDSEGDLPHGGDNYIKKLGLDEQPDDIKTINDGSLSPENDMTPTSVNKPDQIDTIDDDGLIPKDYVTTEAGLLPGDGGANLIPLPEQPPNHTTIGEDDLPPLDVNEPKPGDVHVSGVITQPTSPEVAIGGIEQPAQPGDGKLSISTTAIETVTPEKPMLNMTVSIDNANPSTEGKLKMNSTFIPVLIPGPIGTPPHIALVPKPITKIGKDYVIVKIHGVPTLVRNTGNLDLSSFGQDVDLSSLGDLDLDSLISGDGTEGTVISKLPSLNLGTVFPNWINLPNWILGEHYHVPNNRFITGGNLGIQGQFPGIEGGFGESLWPWYPFPITSKIPLTSHPDIVINAQPPNHPVYYPYPVYTTHHHHDERPEYSYHHHNERPEDHYHNDILDHSHYRNERPDCPRYHYEKHEHPHYHHKLSEHFYNPDKRPELPHYPDEKPDKPNDSHDRLGQYNKRPEIPHYPVERPDKLHYYPDGQTVRDNEIPEIPHYPQELPETSYYPDERPEHPQYPIKKPEQPLYPQSELPQNPVENFVVPGPLQYPKFPEFPQFPAENYLEPGPVQYPKFPEFPQFPAENYLEPGPVQYPQWPELPQNPVENLVVPGAPQYPNERPNDFSYPYERPLEPQPTHGSYDKPEQPHYPEVKPVDPPTPVTSINDSKDQIFIPAVPLQPGDDILTTIRPLTIPTTRKPITSSTQHPKLPQDKPLKPDVVINNTINKILAILKHPHPEDGKLNINLEELISILKHLNSKPENSGFGSVSSKPTNLGIVNVNPGVNDDQKSVLLLLLQLLAMAESSSIARYYPAMNTKSPLLYFLGQFPSDPNLSTISGLNGLHSLSTHGLQHLNAQTLQSLKLPAGVWQLLLDILSGQTIVTKSFKGSTPIAVFADKKK